MFVYLLGDCLDYVSGVNFLYNEKPSILLLRGQSLDHEQSAWDEGGFSRALFVSFPGHTQLLSSTNCWMIAPLLLTIPWGHKWSHRLNPLNSGSFEEIGFEVSVLRFFLTLGGLFQLSLSLVLPINKLAYGLAYISNKTAGLLVAFPKTSIVF